VARLGFEGISPDWDDANADIVALMCSTLEATMQRCDQERDVNREAALDPLTRLLNRSALHRRLGELLGEENGGHRTVVLFADLNHFKQLNDSFGHREGDQVLQTVAEAITSQVRPTDVAARIGGDEFVIVFDAPDESAGTLVARVRGAIDLALSRWEGVSVAVGAISVGPNGTPDDVLERADLAMYRDKATSRPAGATDARLGGGRGSA
jgi:diguanylate cyclase (GGDEF)-like protein